MGDHDRVSPGEPIGPRMTAQWFNNTLPKPQRSGRRTNGLGKTAPNYTPRESELFAVCSTFPAPVPPLHAVGMDALAYAPDKLGRTGVLTDTTNEHNWVVPQEEVATDRIVKVVVGGLTRAVVDIKDPTDLYVTYDNITGTLITTKDRGKAQMLVRNQAPGEPSLILISIYQEFGELRIPGWAKFRALSNIAGGEFQAELLFVSTYEDTDEDILHPENAAPGDEVTIHDPYDMFQNIVVGAVGSAHWRAPYNSNDTPPGVSRWEVEECSLPIDRIRGKVQSCFNYSTPEVTVIFGEGHYTPWMLSDFEHCDIPPEAGATGVSEWSISGVKNRCKLDGIQDAEVIIRRVTSRGPSSPDSDDTLSPPEVQVQWELEEVCPTWQMARWVRALKAGSQWTMNGFWEGGDPTVCMNPIQGDCIFDCSCLEDGDVVVGFYAPEENRYKFISSESALLGQPTTLPMVNSVAFDGEDGCKLNYTYQPVKAFPCGAQPSQGSTSMQKYSMKAYTNIFVSEDTICIGYNIVTVPYCSVGVGGYDCVSICDLLCYCEEFYTLPDACYPPPKPDCNCLDCRFTNGVTGLTITYNGETYSSSTVIPDESEACAWDVEFSHDDGGDTIIWYMRVTYQGFGDWTVSGNWKGEEAISLSGDGDCSGAAVEGLNTNGTATGSVTADGVECEEQPPGGECGCVHCNPDAEVVIDNLSGNISAPQPEMLFDLVPGTQTGRECSYTVSVRIREQNEDQGTMLAFVDLGSDGVWTVRGQRTTPINGYSIDFSVQGEVEPGNPCDGQYNCLANPGSCGQLDYGQLWVSPTECISTQAVLETPDGETVTRTMVKGSSYKGLPPRKSKRGLGTDFANKYPDFFKGCKCKSDVVAVMNRWERGSVSQQQVENLALTIHNKNKEQDLVSIVNLLAEFVVNDQE